MEVVELLAQDGVVANLKAGSKKQALQELSARAATLTGLQPRQIFDVLLERERLGTTGVGQGIAIPHGKLRELERLHGIFARLETPIDFDAIDDEPVGDAQRQHLGRRSPNPAGLGDGPRRGGARVRGRGAAAVGG